MTTRVRRQRGSAVLEFALSFALLWAVFSGVFQFGYSMYVYNSLANAVSQGARYAARVDFDSPSHAFAGPVKNMVVYGSPTGGGTPLAPGLATSQVSVTWTTDAAGVPQTITVGINTYTLNAIFQNFTFTNKPRVTVQFLGSYKT
jgi:Flp pilus assembly protein TadG